MRSTIFVLVALLMSASATLAQPAKPASSTDQKTYDALRKCFVANGYADSPDTKTRQSFDLTYVIGRKMGLPDAQISRDLDFAQLNELPKMVRSSDYFKQAVSTCKALGLM